MRRLLPAILLAVSPAAVATGQIGTPFCPGTGCPCANDDPGAGCGNSGIDGDPASGALLTGAGSADVFADDLVLTTSGVGPGQFGLVLMGEAVPPTVIGDGLLCVGPGQNGLWRFPVQVADEFGSFALASVVSGSQSFGAGGPIVAGATWGFQSWYRDEQSPCGTGSNLSNGLAITFEAAGSTQPIATELAGRPLPSYPHFEFVRNVNEGSDLHAAIDTARMPWLTGTAGELYVVAAKSVGEWDQDPSLIDVRGAPQAWTLVTGGVQANTVLVDAGTLVGTIGEEIGVGYDLVFDADGDGQLGPGDLIDGLGDVAGAYAVRDTAAAGPYGVTEILYNGGSWLLQDIYYPSNAASLGLLPLIVVSHGNGHNYQWYDHLGYHMASYGYVVMSHSNNTGPGIETASETTLRNTDHFLASLDTIAGGVLAGRVDSSNITWIGHSRGGEGVVRAYDRLWDDDYVPRSYSIDSIRLVSSIAPTVFFAQGKSNPHTVDYHLWVGSADADVTGGPSSAVVQSFALLERATGRSAAIVLQGMGHGVFHDGGGSWVASGPCKNGPVKTHKIMRGYFLPLVRYYTEGDPAAKDFLWRQWEAYAPIGKPSNDNGCVVVTYEFQEGPDATLVIDNFQEEPSPHLSSSGEEVYWTVRDLTEGRLDDANTSLGWTTQDPMNGMTRAARAQEQARGIVFMWQEPGVLEFDIPSAERNLADDEYLSFRACQGTRHPSTVSVLEDTTFAVTLIDEAGGEGTIGIDAYGGGIEEPYQRTGLGSGAGWSNEFETIRIRLTDFLADGGGLDLARVEVIRFEFGEAPYSPQGRLGLDDVEIIKVDQ